MKRKYMWDERSDRLLPLMRHDRRFPVQFIRAYLDSATAGIIGPDQRDEVAGRIWRMYEAFGPEEGKSLAPPINWIRKHVRMELERLGVQPAAAREAVESDMWTGHGDGSLR